MFFFFFFFLLSNRSLSNHWHALITAYVLGTAEGSAFKLQRQEISEKIQVPDTITTSEGHIKNLRGLTELLFAIKIII